METVADNGAWRGQRLDRSCYIGGKWVDGESGYVSAVVDPATEQTLAGVSFASVAQVRGAITSARKAFDAGPWRTVSASDRSRLLYRLCDLFEASRDDFINDIIAETGSPVKLARGGQFQAALECLQWFAEAAKRGPSGAYEYGLPLQYKPIVAASLLRQEPAGVVAGITAYNYPLLLLARKLGGVLASGCTTVTLPSEQAPLSIWRFYHLIAQTDYPEGVANLVMGGKDAGVVLTTDAAVDVVTFTGSVSVGREVMRQAAGTTKRVVLELGGKSPTIILPGADLERCVEPSIRRFTVAAGQGCGCTTRTLVAEDDHDAYLEAAQSSISDLRVGDPRAASTDVGPLISSTHRENVEGYVDRAVQDGAEIVAGGGRPTKATGYYMNPVYISGIPNDAELSQTELFGPVGILSSYSTVDAAIETANSSRFGLHAAVWGPTGDALRVAQRLSAGTVTINGGGRRRPDVPWGGYRDSGNGREGGEDGFREFFETKHITWRV